MHLRVACMLAALLLLGGCRNDTTGPDKPETPRVVVRISANASTFSTTRPLVLEVTVRNLTGEILDLGYGSSSCWLGLAAEKDGRSVDIGLDIACTADWVHKTLGPGTERTERLLVDGVDWSDSPYRTLEPGLYELAGVLGEHRSRPIVVEFLGGPVPHHP